MCMLMSVHGPSAGALPSLIPNLKNPLQILHFDIAFGYDHPKLAIISSGDSAPDMKYAHWGLIPTETTNRTRALELRKMSINARSETMFERPMFRQAAARGRCLVPVTGFIEFHELGKKKYPFFCHRNGEPFVLAGLSATWVGPESGQPFHSFTVVTTQADPFMSVVHNHSLRMPLVLEASEFGPWLDPETDLSVVQQMTANRSVPGLNAHPISTSLMKRGQEKNRAENLNAVEYPELEHVVSQLHRIRAYG